jgi:glycosyltransferase involved in cell wall biosynthesis
MSILTSRGSRIFMRHSQRRQIPPNLFRGVKNFAQNWKTSDLSEIPFYGRLDVPSSHLQIDDEKMIRLGGWCVDRQGRAATHVWIQRNEVQIPCKVGWPRPDVVESFGDTLEIESKCGFNILIEAEKGVNNIEVFAQFPESNEIFRLFRKTIVRIGAEHPGQLDQDYQSWVELYDTVDAESEQRMLGIQSRWKAAPKISVLLPTYNTDAKLLTEAIESVRKQIYPNWELCVADDASPATHVTPILEHYARIDDRIKFTVRERNGHISAATNSALEMATGEFCALLDHDDVLPRHALFHVAELIVSDPDVTLIFSDEDKIDEDGRRFDPYFKSDWNPELFLSHNCVSHLGVFKTSILREINGFQEDLYGSQDWDLALRFIAKAGESGIRHIPRVLYHWRYLDSSTSKSIDIKPYAIEAGRRAIEGYLKHLGSNAEVTQGFWGGSFQVAYKIDRPYQASIIILDGHTCVAESAIASLLAGTEYSHYEILHGVSASETNETSIADSRVVKVPLKATNRAEALNELAAHAQGEILVFIDATARFAEADWLEKLVAHAIQPQVGAVGPWLVSPASRTLGNGIIFGDHMESWMPAFKGLLTKDIGHMGRAHLAQRYSALRGECFATKRSVFQSLNGFEKCFSEFFWSFDYCLKLSNSRQLCSLFTPTIQIQIASEYSGFFEASESEFAQLRAKWGCDFPRDPYFNPNLHTHDPRFFLAWPPRV